MELIQEISEYLQKGRAKNVKALVQQAIDEGIDPKVILNEGLLSGMMIIGGKFKNNEVFVPEVLVAARAMNAGLTILEPKLIEIGNEPVGKAVVGTVQGDLHDIGKNLVVMMLKGAGFEVYDLGVDVETPAFLEKAEEVGADLYVSTSYDNYAKDAGVYRILKREKYAGQIYCDGRRSSGQSEFLRADRCRLLYTGCGILCRRGKTGCYGKTQLRRI